MGLSHHQSVLDNKIRVVTDHAPHFESVAIAISFAAGSLHERQGQSGIAHLLEHSVFRGTTHRSGKQVQDAIAALGGYVNAETTEIRTTYEAVVLAEDVPKALELLADITLNPRLKEEDVLLEKHIVTQEMCGGCRNCDLRDAFNATCFGDHPLRNPVIGREESVMALVADDLRAFHAAQYCGANLTVALAGAISHAQAVDLIGQAFSALPAGVASEVAPVCFTAGETLLVQDDDRGHLRIGFALPAHDRAAFDIYAALLGGSPDALLMRELRDKRGLVYSAGAGVFELAGTPLLIVDLSGDVGRMTEIASITMDCIGALAGSVDPGLLATEVRRREIAGRMAHDNLALRAHRLLETGAASWQMDTPSPQRIEAAVLAALSQSPTLIATGPVRHMPRFSELRARHAQAIDMANEQRRSSLKLVS